MRVLSIKEVYDRIARCLDFEDYCVNCRDYKANKCTGIRNLLEDTLDILGEVLDNGMESN